MSQGQGARLVVPCPLRLAVNRVHAPSENNKMSLLDSPPQPHHFGADHEAFRAAMRAFVAHEITPFVNEWDEACTFPRALYRKAAEIGDAAAAVRQALIRTS